MEEVDNFLNQEQVLIFKYLVQHNRTPKRVLMVEVYSFQIQEPTLLIFKVRQIQTL